MGSDSAGDPDPLTYVQSSAPATGETASPSSSYPTKQSLYPSTSSTANPTLPRDSGNPQSLQTPSHDMATLASGTSRKASIQQQRTARWQADVSNHPSSDENPTPNLHSPHHLPSSAGATEQERNTTEFEPQRESRRSPDTQRSDDTAIPDGSVALTERPPDHLDHRLTTKNVNQMAAREPSDTSSSRSGSYAAAGYVHLAPLSADGKTDKVMSTQDRNDDGGDDDLTRSRGGVAPLWDRSYGSVVSTSESVSPYPKTARFEHVKTDQGHFISMGRRGTLERCEDEPIHTPGAVQGYGVLIALEEDEENGTFIVRQVSENCSELLGLSPSYLFDLDCFTETLPKAHADNLRTRIEYLSNDTHVNANAGVNSNGPPPTTTDSKEITQVFLLSLYGQPGSFTNPFEECNVDAILSTSNPTSTTASDMESVSNYTSNYSATDPDPSTGSNNTKRKKTSCWCAVHRPPRSTTTTKSSADYSNNFVDLDLVRADHTTNASQSNIIILELELEHDIYNPVYPFQDYLRSPSSGTQNDDNGDGIRREQVNSSDETVRPPSTDTVRAGQDSTSSHMPSPTNFPSTPDVGNTPTPSTPGIIPSSPTVEQILASTTSKSQPIRALERMRHAERAAQLRRMEFIRRGSSNPNSSSVTTSGSGLGSGPGRGSKSAEKSYLSGARRLGTTAGSGSLDVFAVLGQVNDQLSGAKDLQTLLDVVTGIVKDLTQFHRTLVYQFDEDSNGQVVSELIDWSKTQDIYRGFHFPAGDIPVQAREMYKLNKVRSLYNREQATARLVGRTAADVETPLDLTHSYLRAMSPIHLEYLKYMKVRSSMSLSIVAFGQLWGLIVCHSYGEYGMRVSFPMRQILLLLSDAITRNVERVIQSQRLQSSLLKSISTDIHPTSHIVGEAEELLHLFNADFGVLVIGEGAKILGPNQHGQDILIIAEYLRVKRFRTLQVTRSINKDFPDINHHAGPNVISGFICVPLSPGGEDFIAFLRKSQEREIVWAGRANKSGTGAASMLPRQSFEAWTETISGVSKEWTPDQLETAGVITLVYGRFIDVWRQKEAAEKASQYTNLLLANASQEVRTPLGHIISYLELAMNGPLDPETRENLKMSHAASKNLLFTINDLLDLTRLQQGSETSLDEPFDFAGVISDAVQVYRTEAERRGIQFVVSISNIPKLLVGNAKKMRTIVANLTANAVKYTEKGVIRVDARLHGEPTLLRAEPSRVLIEVTVSDTGCGIKATRLQGIFRELEQVEHLNNNNDPDDGVTGLGLGLAVAARAISKMGGQLRVDSTPGSGSKFMCLIPFDPRQSMSSRSSHASRRPSWSCSEGVIERIESRDGGLQPSESEDVDVGISSVVVHPLLS